MAKKKNNNSQSLGGECIKPLPVGQLAEECYTLYGSYVNTHRAIANVADGCKVSYKRIIYMMTKHPRGKDVPTHEFVPSLSEVHPHSTDGCEGLNAMLVRSGVFSGHGFFGNTDIDGTQNPHAATRYTKNRLSDLYWDIIGDLIKEVPYEESPQGPLEPTYIPLPIPLCLRWDTKVRLTDGRDITMKELAEEFKNGKDNFVLSCNLDGDFTVSKIIDAQKTKTTNNYVRITLDNGEVINSTRDHLFMLRDGSYKKAEELVVNESLMPGYINTSSDGRACIKNNYSLNYPPIYKLSDLYNISHGVYENSEKMMIHHKDKNKLNDNPDNLIRLTRSEHSKLHAEDLVIRVKSDEVRQKIKDGVKKYWSDENNRIKARIRWKELGDVVSDRSKRNWKVKGDIADLNGKTWRDISRENITKYNKSDLAKENLKKYWASEKGLERKKNITVKANSDPDNTRKALRGKIMTKFKSLIKDSGKTFDEALEQITNQKNFSKWFSDVNDFLEMEKTYNHNIVSIEFIESEVEEDFYDITVDSRYHNFLLSAGVVVHNCMYMRGGLVEGLGVGVRTLYPNFSPTSLYRAWKENNPALLEPNVDLILDKENSELEKLWYTGTGKVIYAYKVSKSMSPDGKSEGVLFETTNGTEIFTPSLKKFDKLVEDGKVYIENLTDKTSSKLFIGRVPGARGISYADIEKIARQICFNLKTYQLNVTDGNSAFRIPLKDWIGYTYNNYINLVTEVNNKRIEKCKFDILVQESIPIIGELLLKNPAITDKDIQKLTGISEDVIKVVCEKPISYLRKNKDTADRVKALRNRLKDLKSFDPVKFTENIIKMM